MTHVKNISNSPIDVDGVKTLKPGEVTSRSKLTLDDGDLEQCIRRGQLEMVTGPKRKTRRKPKAGVEK